MATPTSSVSSTGRQAQAQAEHQTKKWVPKAARAGYVARGIIYLIIGALAVDAAIGAGGATTGSQGVLERIATQPFGQVLLVILAVGFFGLALWRFAEGILDVENKGSDAEGIGKRLFLVGVGLLYVGLGVSAVRLIMGGGGGGGGSQRQEWTAEVLSQPFGQWIVGIFGAFIIGLGIVYLVKAVKAKFMEKFKTHEMSEKERRLAKRSGQFGISARSVVFVIIGGFFIQAAIQAEPGEAEGLGAALDTLAQQPFGPWLLGLVAAGLFAFGVYSFVYARYRQFDVG